MPSTDDLIAELVKLRPAERQARFYRLAVWPDLFGRFSLAREYGRIGQSGTLRVDTFAAEAEACAVFRRLLRHKQRRGYSVLATAE
jgi:predicted DNA-binding WGR domain protein